MKKPVSLILICLVSASAFAFGNHGRSPILDNTSIRRSEKSMNSQMNTFQNHRRYSSQVNSHRSRALRKQQGKAAPDGSGL